MQVPIGIFWLTVDSEGKCGNISRVSVEKIPQLWQNFNRNSP